MKSLGFLQLLLAVLPVLVYGEIVEERASNWTVGQIVQTSSGPVTGHAASNDSEVSEYLGIKFGQAARFAAPVLFNSTSPQNGTSFGYSCPFPQTASTGTNITASNVTAAGIAALGVLTAKDPVYDEDCLNLNIWTKPQVGESKKAVMIWIYGGGFHGGQSSIPAYNGANIVEQEDVIVVSINYRLSILGFPGNPSTQANLGLLDQRLAVEWVKDNIENFGGDPSRITLFGQSAGGASVDLYSYAWASDPIAAGFIPESGTVFIAHLSGNDKELTTAAWFNVTTTLGCGNASSNQTAVLSCVQSKNFTEIQNAVPPASDAISGILGRFGPTVDDTLVFANYSQRTPAKVPMLIGNNDYEAGLFRTELATQNIFYSDVFWEAFDLEAFTCPAGIRANTSIANGNPTWRYRYMGIFPNLEISSEAGTWHAAEIPMIFDTTPLVPAATPEQISIGNYMRKAWTTFAKDPVNGLNNYGWPQYDPSKDTLIRLAYDNITGTNLINPYKYDADCVLVNVTNLNVTDVPSSLPDLGANVVPTATASSTGGSSTSGSSPASTSTQASSGGRLEVGAWIGLMGGLFAVLFV